MTNQDAVFVSTASLGLAMQGTRKQFEDALENEAKAWYAEYLANEPESPALSFSEYFSDVLNEDLEPAHKFSEAELEEIPSL